MMEVEETHQVTSKGWKTREASEKLSLTIDLSKEEAAAQSSRAQRPGFLYSFH